MDLERIVLFLKAFGFPTAIAVWFLWKIQVFMDASVVNSTLQVELLRRLIEIHR